MGKRSDEQFLLDVVEAIGRIHKYTVKRSYQTFLKHFMTQDAVVRNLEIIGEATKNISPSFKKKHAAIPWRKMAGMRDKIIHYYFGVNWDIVWDVIKNKLPEVREEAKRILKQLH